jgi:hypothetical protein
MKCVSGARGGLFSCARYYFRIFSPNESLIGETCIEYYSIISYKIVSPYIYIYAK